VKSIERLMAQWRQQGIDCPAGASPDALAEFESRRGVVLPADMRSYFLAVNGMGPRQEVFDDAFCSFWPVESVTSVADEFPDRAVDVPGADRYFLFADHSLNLPAYAVRLSSDPHAAAPVATLFSDRGAFAMEDVFESFGAFLERYLDNPFDAVILPRDTFRSTETR